MQRHQYAPKGKNELTPLQEDVKRRLGIVVDLRDSVYCPTREKLANLWAKCKLNRIGGNYEYDQDSLAQLLKAFEEDPELFKQDDLLEYQFFKGTKY